MRELPLNALRAFAVTYSEGGIRAAARELGVVHSSISRHLSQLEAWLGVPLSHESRGRNGLIFTSQGKLLGKAVSAGLQEIERTVAALREARSAYSVTVSTTPSFAARWLLPRLPQFEAGHPRIEVSILVDQKPVELAPGETDLAVRMGRGPWGRLRCEPLMDDCLYPVMSPTFWSKSGRPDAPAGLAGLRLLHDRDPQAGWEVWRQAYGPAALNVSKGPRYASSDLLLRAAIQGQGVALARHRMVADDVASGVLMRPMGKSQIRIDSAYWVVLPVHPAASPATRTFIDWLRDQATAD